MVSKVSHSWKHIHMLCFIPMPLIFVLRSGGKTSIYFGSPIDFSLTAYLHKSKHIPENLQDQQLASWHPGLKIRALCRVLPKRLLPNLPWNIFIICLFVCFLNPGNKVQQVTAYQLCPPDVSFSLDLGENKSLRNSHCVHLFWYLSVLATEIFFFKKKKSWHRKDSLGGPIKFNEFSSLCYVCPLSEINL